MTLRLAAMIGLLAGLVPATAHAQTNLDQGKSPAQIFAADCAACHKAARGLAKGRDSAALTDFLREHYTTGREQAAALAAYVLRGGGGDAGAAAAQGQKPAADHAKASAEEPKPAKPQPRQVAKPQRPAEENTKPEEKSAPDETPSVALPVQQRPTAERHEKRQAAVPRNRRKEPETAPASMPESIAAPEPAAAAPEAAPTETPNTEAPNAEAPPTPTAAAPTANPSDEAPGEATPVPRDNIPD